MEEFESTLRCGVHGLERSAARRLLEHVVLLSRTARVVRWKEILAACFLRGSRAAADAAAVGIGNLLSRRGRRESEGGECELDGDDLGAIREGLMLVLATVQPEVADAAAQLTFQILVAESDASDETGDKAAVVFAARAASGPREINLAMIRWSYLALAESFGTPDFDRIWIGLKPWFEEILTGASLSGEQKAEYRSVLCQSIRLVLTNSGAAMDRASSDLLSILIGRRNYRTGTRDIDSALAHDLCSLAADFNATSSVLRFALIAGLEGKASFTAAVLGLLWRKDVRLLQRVIGDAIGVGTFISITVLVALGCVEEDVSTAGVIIRSWIRVAPVFERLEDAVCALAKLFLDVLVPVVTDKDAIWLKKIVDMFEKTECDDRPTDFDAQLLNEYCVLTATLSASNAGTALQVLRRVRHAWASGFRSHGLRQALVCGLADSVEQSKGMKGTTLHDFYLITGLYWFMAHPQRATRRYSINSISKVADTSIGLTLIPYTLNRLSRESSPRVALLMMERMIPSLARNNTASITVASLLMHLIDYGGPLGEVALCSLARVAADRPLQAFALLTSITTRRTKEWESLDHYDRAASTSSALIAIRGRPARGADFVPLIQQSLLSYDSSPFAAANGLEALYELCEEGVLDPAKAIKIVAKTLQLSVVSVLSMEEGVRTSFLRFLGAAGRVKPSGKSRTICKNCVSLLREIVMVERGKIAAVLEACESLVLFQTSFVLEFEEMDEERADEVAHINAQNIVRFVESLLAIAKKNTTENKSVSKLLKVILVHEWEERSRSAFAGDRLQRLRMTSAALQRARHREESGTKASMSSDDVRSEFLEYCSFLPEGAIKTVTSATTLLLSRENENVYLGAFACKILCDTEVLPSGLPWGSLIRQFWRCTKQFTRHELALDAIIELIFLLPKEVGSTHVFSLLSLAGGQLSMVPLSCWPRVLSKTFELDQRNLVTQLFQYFVSANLLIETVKNMSASLDISFVEETGPRNVTKVENELEWFELVLNHYLECGEEISIELAEPLGRLVGRRKLEDIGPLLSRLHHANDGELAIRSARLICKALSWRESVLLSQFDRAVSPIFCSEVLLRHLSTLADQKFSEFVQAYLYSIYAGRVETSQREMVCLELLERSSRISLPNLHLRTMQMISALYGLTWMIDIPQDVLTLLPILASHTSNQRLAQRFVQTHMTT
mmetsp:Transcript_6118/g.11959  ORF Transcript_6118/g.11959 Transcript_6118/m.11959 type:complete len:1191 (-) Transcript_6118:1897-5469(-)